MSQYMKKKKGKIKIKYLQWRGGRDNKNQHQHKSRNKLEGEKKICQNKKGKYTKKRRGGKEGGNRVPINL